MGRGQLSRSPFSSTLFVRVSYHSTAVSEFPSDSVSTFPSHRRNARLTDMSHFSWLLRLVFGIQFRSSVLCSKCHVTSPVWFLFPFSALLPITWLVKHSCVSYWDGNAVDKCLFTPYRAWITEWGANEFISIFFQKHEWRGNQHSPFSASWLWVPCNQWHHTTTIPSWPS